MRADLNRDGIPDLAVADKARSDVLIYGGRSDGKLSPPVVVSHAFLASGNPDGVTAADLTGDGLPELVLARKGADDALVLLNRSSSGSLFFTAGAQLNSGSGPVSIVVSDFNGDGIPDVLVNRGGPDGAILVPGEAGAVFGDQRPVERDPGSRPGSTPAPKGAGQPDLALAEFGDSILPGIADGGAPEHMIGSGAPGDLDSATAFGSARAGTLALFDGRSKGMSLMLTEPGLLDSMEQALLALSSGERWFPTASAGVVSAGLVGLGLDVDSALSIDATESATAEARLVPLNQSSLALLATVLESPNEAQTKELTGDLARTEVTSGAAFLPGESRPTDGQRLQRVQEGPDRQDPADVPGVDKGATIGAARSSTMTWERFVIGLDEALAGFRSQNQWKLSGDPDRGPVIGEQVAQPPPGSSACEESTSGTTAPEECARDASSGRIGGETPTCEAESARPAEASLPLIASAAITGWALIARSTQAGKKKAC
jgi:hypothetical protein